MHHWIPAFSTLMLTIYFHSQEAGVHLFQDLVLEKLKALVPFDSAMWGTATVRPKGLDIHTFHLHNSSPEMVKAYEKVKHLDTIPAELARHEKTTLVFNAETMLAGKKLLPLRQFSREFGHENMLITSQYDAQTQLLQWIALLRRDRAQVCKPAEATLLTSLAPHLMQALAMNRRVHMDALLSEEARIHWCSAIADARGVVLHADPGFLDLIEPEWPCPRQNQLAPALVKQLSGSPVSLVGKAAVVEISVVEGVWFLKARRRQPIDSLSSSELMVARLLASGLTQKEVALKLKRSSETVRSHVRNIFEKLGISSAVMLAAALSITD
jgi:DNA-binding CsgD family transcriptional regulator